MRRFVERIEDNGRYCPNASMISNPVRVIDVFVDALDLAEMSFARVEPAARSAPRVRIVGDLEPPWRSIAE